MKLKMDEKGAVVVSDGKPVYVADDGSEVAFDYPATRDSITRLNGEARKHRERAEAAEGRLKTFDGIEDAEKARKALATVANLDAKKLVDAGEVETIKAEAIKSVEARFAPIVEERDGLKGQLFKEIVGGSFARSKFIADKMVIPPDLAEARFGQHFAVEDGRVIAKGADGNRIYSRAKPGEPADFDEALDIIVAAYPQRDRILKGSGASGGGASGGGSGGGGRKTLTRALFNGLSPAEQAATAKTATIVD